MTTDWATQGRCVNFLSFPFQFRPFIVNRFAVALYFEAPTLSAWLTSVSILSSKGINLAVNMYWPRCRSWMVIKLTPSIP